MALNLVRPRLVPQTAPVITDEEELRRKLHALRRLVQDQYLPVLRRATAECSQEISSMKLVSSQLHGAAEGNDR